MDGESQQVVCALVGRNFEANDASGAVELADDGERDRASEDRDRRSVFCNETCKVTCVGKHDDQINVEILDSGDSRSSKSFGGAHRAWGKELDIIVDTFVVEASLSFSTALAHDCYGLERVLTTSRLTRKHGCIGTIKNSVCDVRSFGTSRSGVADH